MEWYVQYKSDITWMGESGSALAMGASGVFTWKTTTLIDKQIQNALKTDLQPLVSISIWEYHVMLVLARLICTFLWIIKEHISYSYAAFSEK